MTFQLGVYSFGNTPLSDDEDPRLDLAGNS